MKRLYKVKENKVFAGVCGGIAEYFNIDPVIIRIVWVMVSLAYGFGVIAYIIAAIIIPEKKSDQFGNLDQDTADFESDSSFSSGFPKRNYSFDPEKSRLVIGATVIGIGLMLLLKQFFHWFDFKVILALGIIVAGVFVLYKGGRNNI